MRARAGGQVGGENLDDSPSDTAFLRLAEQELPATYRIAAFLLGDAQEAQDALQEALLRAWTAWPGMREHHRFAAWFGRIVINTCRNRLRDRHGVRWISLDGEASQAAELRDPFGGVIGRDELGRLVRNLSRDHQVVIVLRFWNDYSLQEIAETLGVPVGTVKSRLNHAIGALRKLYEKQSAGTSRMG